MKLKLYISNRQANVNQEYEVLAEIMRAAFGGKGSNSANENVVEPKTAAEAVSAFKSMFGGKKV